MLGTTSAVHAHTKHFYCASSKKLLKISEPMITATQIVWKYFRWIRSQLQPFLLVMTAIYYFYRSNQTKIRDWKRFYRIFVYHNETKISGRKLWNLTSRAQFDWVLWYKDHWSHNGFSIKQSNAFYFCIRWWL